MTNTMMSHLHLFRVGKKEQVGGEFTIDKNYTRTERKNWLENCLKAFQNAAATFEIVLVWRFVDLYIKRIYNQIRRKIEPD